jgi:hypothetical protein
LLCVKTSCKIEDGGFGEKNLHAGTRVLSTYGGNGYRQLLFKYLELWQLMQRGYGLSSQDLSAISDFSDMHKHFRLTPSKTCECGASPFYIRRHGLSAS